MANNHDDTPIAPKPWIVCSTHVNQEQLAITHLKRQQYDIYCPMYIKSITHARRVDKVKRPLFPGYMFVHADPVQDNWRPVLSTMGIRSVVRFGENLGTLSDDFIQSLRSREQDGHIVTPAHRYRVGQHVQINGGPFDGVVATILSMDDNERLVVLMDIMRRSVHVKIEANKISGR